MLDPRIVSWYRTLRRCYRRPEDPPGLQVAPRYHCHSWYGRVVRRGQAHCT
ncbi:hypothetical protein EIP86_004392 [Pleurotus ostreatoroseus]|nr:hypothetical protein EIP86_004392 [Pleurotus ostreatoroseus]